MDVLKSELDKLCTWLSSDPDYILDECGDILSMNEFREVQKQSSPLDKMRVLLKMILHRGEDACRSFFDILRQHQAHYPQLQQLFNNSAGSSTPTVFADSNSVVTTREINAKGKSLSMKIETVIDSGSNPSGNGVGQVCQADYNATGGSVICADKICGTIDGDIDLSVSVKTSQVRAGMVGETLQPSSQGPAVKMITEHKVELIDCLRADHVFIMQHVHAKHIVTDRQYQNIKSVSLPENTVTDLIDQVIGKGQESCSLFLEVLKDPDVLRTYPQLKKITNDMC